MYLTAKYENVAHLLGKHGRRFHQIFHLCPPEVRKLAYEMLIGDHPGIVEVPGVGAATLNALNEQVNISFRMWTHRPWLVPNVGAVARAYDMGLWGANVRRRDFVYLSQDEHIIVDVELWHWGEATIRNLRDYAMRLAGFGGSKEKPAGLTKLRMLMFDLQTTLENLSDTDRIIAGQYIEEALLQFKGQGLTP
jgi:hypothetical protein